MHIGLPERHELGSSGKRAPPGVFRAKDRWHHNAIGQQNIIPINNVVFANGGNPERVTVRGETVSRHGKESARHDGWSYAISVERSLWRDLCSDWIPAICGNDGVDGRGNDALMPDDAVAGVSHLCVTAVRVRVS